MLHGSRAAGRTLGIFSTTGLLFVSRTGSRREVEARSSRKVRPFSTSCPHRGQVRLRGLVISQMSEKKDHPSEPHDDRELEVGVAKRLFFRAA